MARCAPTHVMRFFEHHDLVAESTYCAEPQRRGPNPKVDARFSIPDTGEGDQERSRIAGGISVNAAEVQAVWEDETSDLRP